MNPLLVVIAAAAALSAGFEVSYQPRSRDGAGRFMGGTEMRVLTAHAGKLYAGNGYWEDTPGPEGRQGSQILVLDAPDAGWRVDRAGSISPDTTQTNRRLTTPLGSSADRRRVSSAAYDQREITISPRRGRSLHQTAASAKPIGRRLDLLRTRRSRSRPRRCGGRSPIDGGPPSSGCADRKPTAMCLCR